MAKGNGNTRTSTPAQSSQPQTFEQQVDTALTGLRSEFFQRMEDYYVGWEKRWQEGFAEWKKAEDYISAAGPSASAQANRAQEVVNTHYSNKTPLQYHSEQGRSLRDNYSDLVAGGYYKEGAKAPNFYDLARGRANVSEMSKAVKATAERNAKRAFTNVRSKMLKTTVEKGINLQSARVESANDNGFLISDGKVTLHARYIMAWGEIKAPHFRFIITDRKSK